ncbi:MAG TPA: TIM barrel protein [Candidatus Sulfopaludibacter sp.]|jgi:sugar phosphate isomerase/epimerase|nr:TIM barrel protein [Candidatus Sulfopaludibacter sp.]
MLTGVSRRALLGAGTALAASAWAIDDKAVPLKVAIFSKHLAFLQGEELARTAKELGFDGIDVTVRKGGHVEPSRVKQDLPPLVATLRKAGLEVPMITTEIVDADTPYTEDILRTMAGLAISSYRWMPPGGLKYNFAEPYPSQLERLKPRVAKLAKLNAGYKVGAMWHTHSGVGYVGASFWDIWMLLKDQDPQAVGVNYDVGHATIEGGMGGWINDFHIMGPYLRGIAVKDFYWAKDAKGVWKAQWAPLGDGMVHLPQFFGMVKQAGFHGPVQLHFEYPLGGADAGKTTLTIPREEVLSAMKRDLGKLRGYMGQAGL